MEVTHCLVDTRPTQQRIAEPVLTGYLPTKLRLYSTANIRFMACMRLASSLHPCMTDPKWRYNSKVVKKTESLHETSGVMLCYRHGRLIEGTNRETCERQSVMTCCYKKNWTRQKATHAVKIHSSTENSLTQNHPLSESQYLSPVNQALYIDNE